MAGKDTRISDARPERRIRVMLMVICIGIGLSILLAAGSALPPMVIFNIGLLLTVMLVGYLWPVLGKVDQYRQYAADQVDIAKALEREIALREQAEKALATERNLLRSIVSNLPDQIYAKDRNSAFVFTNSSCACAMQAQSPQAMLGKTDFDFLPDHLAEEFR